MRRLGHVVAGVLLVGALAACGSDTDAGDAPGDVVTVAGNVTQGDQSWLQLPGGRLTLTVTEAVDVLPADETADAREHEAGADQTYLGVGWSYVVGEGIPGWLGPVLTGDEIEIPVRLRTGGATYELGVAARSPDTAADVSSSGGYVLVEGDGAEVELEVDLAGVTQTVDARTGQRETGQAAALYELADLAPDPDDCTRAVLPQGVTSDLACGWWTAEVPYVAGQGWADDGWTVAQLTTSVSTWSRAGSTWQAGTITDASGAGAGAPVSTLVEADEPGQLTQLLAFAGRVESIRLDRRVAGVLAEGTGPDRAELALTADLTLP